MRLPGPKMKGAPKWGLGYTIPSNRYIYILFITRVHVCGEKFKILIFPLFFVILFGIGPWKGVGKLTRKHVMFIRLIQHIVQVCYH